MTRTLQPREFLCCAGRLWQDIFRELSEEIEEGNIPEDLGGACLRPFYDSPQELELSQLVASLNAK